MKKLLILANRPLHTGPRMIREIETFKNDFEIITIGKTPLKNNQFKFTNIDELTPFVFKVINAIFRKLFFYNLLKSPVELYPKIRSHIIQNNIDIVITHEPVYLPCLLRIKKTKEIKIIYNAHEYHPLEFEDQPNWLNTFGRYFSKIYSDCLKNIDLLINVCDGIAEKCKKEFGVDSTVIPNVALYSDIPIHDNMNTPIRLIYHGGVMKSRKNEEMIKVAEILGNSYELDIIAVALPSEKLYFDEITQLANKTSNVKILPPVSFNDIVPTINKYDIGIFLLPPTNFNYTHALPNKLYEFIQAKLAIAISPSPEMKKVVEQYDLGVVADDFTPENLANKIKELTRKDILFYKNNSLKASKIETAEKYQKIYLNAVLNLFK
jgi:hypothetical protein